LRFVARQLEGSARFGKRQPTHVERAVGTLDGGNARGVEADYANAYYDCMHEDGQQTAYGPPPPAPGYAYGPPPAYYYPAPAYYPYPYYYGPSYGPSISFGFGFGGGHGWGGHRGFHGGGWRHH